MHDENLELLTQTQNISRLEQRKKISNNGEEYNSQMIFSKIPCYQNDAQCSIYSGDAISYLVVMRCWNTRLQPRTAPKSDRVTGKLKSYSPLSHVASGSCAWSRPLNMSSMVTFFLEAKLSSSSVSRRVPHYF